MAPVAVLDVDGYVPEHLALELEAGVVAVHDLVVAGEGGDVGRGVWERVWGRRRRGGWGRGERMSAGDGVAEDAASVDEGAIGGGAEAGVMKKMP